MLKQFDQVKSILINFSYNERGRNVLVAQIIWNVIDELRRERKIKMVLHDEINVNQYINLDMTDVNLLETGQHLKLDPFVQLALQDKIDFRFQFG